MTSYTWNTGTGNFNTSSNWNPAGVPGAGDTAIFNTGSGTITGSSTETVSALNITGGGPWTWQAAINSSYYLINSAVSLSGTFNLTGSPTSNQYMGIGPMAAPAL